MKSFKLKKLVAMALTLATVATVSPVAASAAWKVDSYGWWNTEGSSYSTGWRSIDGTWYLFGADGYMKTGWVMDNGKWYFLQSDGAMKNGWVYNKYDDKWYYTGESGAMETGFITDAGNLYYLDTNGAMLSGWFQVNGAKYYANYSGVVQKGVIQIVGKTYYFDEEGKLVTGEVTINGVKYTFAETGECQGKAPKASRAYDAIGKEIPVVYDEDTDSEETEKVSHGGGGGGNDHSSVSLSAAEKVQNAYTPAALLDSSKYVEEGNVVPNNYEVTFKNNDVESVTDKDYVTRDIMVTNGKIVNKENGKYIVEAVDPAQPVKVKGVVRVVSDGVAYYLNSAEQVISNK